MGEAALSIDTASEVVVDNISYVYAYLDPREPGKFEYDIEGYGESKFDNEPIYIGKGIGNRIHGDHSHNPYLTNKTNKILREGFELIKIKLMEDMLDDDAINMEIAYIAGIGRADLNKGPLTNLTDGGQGWFGRRHTEETNKKLSEIKKGKPGVKHTVETKKKQSESKLGVKNPNWGKKHTEERKKSIALFHTGKKRPPETGRKIGEAQMGSKNHRWGKKLSKEERQRMSERYSKYWELTFLYEDGRKEIIKNKNKYEKAHSIWLKPNAKNPKHGISVRQLAPEEVDKYKSEGAI